VESFWSSLKRELVHRCEFATRTQARQASFEGIEIFYNRERFHSASATNPLWTLQTTSTKKTTDGPSPHALSTKPRQGQFFNIRVLSP
jgi:transposase InsO family protein